MKKEKVCMYTCVREEARGRVFFVFVFAPVTGHAGCWSIEMERADGLSTWMAEDIFCIFKLLLKQV